MKKSSLAAPGNKWKRICRMRLGEGEKKFALPFRKRGRVIAE
jgi:hypothetical protein